MPLSPGQQLGSFEIVSSIGAGGMGEVYRARDTRLDRDVALKILPQEVTNEPGRLERFDREARAIAALNHPHIVTIYSTEQVDDVRFLTMELVDGCTLGDLVLPAGMAIPRFLEIAIPLADALAAAHQKQITHRDLKPGNVMVSSEGRVKVLDFGLARVGGANAGEQTLIATQAPITHQGTIVGTMPYMSPEQVEGRHLDARSDLFSLGVIFYELLNGGRPFQGSSSPALMSAILRDTPSSVCEKRPDVPEAIDRLISRLLEKRPEDRVQTARDVYNELRHVQRTFDARSSGVQRTAAPSAHNLWIAVLPFTSRGTNPDAEAMAAGLTDDITTSLAKFSGLSVVAAQSTRAFKDSPLDVRQIAERISARYMASGSVRQSGSAFRVSAQLIDAQTGAQLWSETYDRRLENSDLFAIQDDLTDRIVATVADESGVLARSMARSIGQTTIDDPNEQQLIVQMWGFQHDPTPPRHEELRATIERQVELHPNSAEAWADLANLYVVEHALLFNPRPDPLGRALRAARRAVEIDRGCQKGWLWLGITHFHLHDRRGLDEAFERAIAINPRNANAMGWMGNILAHAGDYDRGSALSERAMQINPGHPGWLHFVVFTRQFAHGAFEEALQAARRVNIPNFFWMHFAIAAACGQLGRAQEGKAAYDAMVRIAPALGDGANLREFVSRWYWDEAMTEALIDGVRRSLNDRSKPPSGISTDQSIAVLPFVDLSETKDQDWFCDGIAEEIMNALAGLPGLRVAPRTSAFSFRGRVDDLEAIGERLNVNTVLEGSVRRAGDRVRITTRLSDAQLGRQLWSERFDRELKDIFDVQDEIARAVADRLRVTIAGAGVRLVQKATTNIAAYELMLKGRVFLNRRGPAIANAIPCFEQAIRLDPNLADAHAGLGDSYRLFGIYGLMPTHQASALARASIERALAIDPDQVEALATLANIMHAFEWNYAEARALSDRTLQRDPSHVRALAESAVTLSTSMSEHPSEGLRQLILDRIARARVLDPLSAWAMAVEAMIFSILGRDQDAVDAAARAVATDPNNFTAHWTRVLTLAKQNRAAEAEEAAKPGLAMSSRHPILLTDLATLHASGGDTAGAESIYQELTERSKTSFISPCACAIAAGAAGRMTDARRLLAQAIADRDAFISFHKFAAFRPLWGDPECAAMIRQSPLMRNAPS